MVATVHVHVLVVQLYGYGERNVEVCLGEKQAGDEAGTRDQRREDAHEGDAAAGVRRIYLILVGCIKNLLVRLCVYVRWSTLY